MTQLPGIGEWTLETWLKLYAKLNEEDEEQENEEKSVSQCFAYTFTFNYIYLSIYMCNVCVSQCFDAVHFPKLLRPAVQQLRESLMPSQSNLDCDWQESRR